MRAYDFSVHVEFQPGADTEMQPRGYLLGGEAWAAVRTDHISIAAPEADFPALLRLADAIRAAVAQAQHADLADLADLAVTS